MYNFYITVVSLMNLSCITYITDVLLLYICKQHTGDIFVTVRLEHIQVNC